MTCIPRQQTVSFYNLLFGRNQMAPLLLQALELSAADVPRFRDCYLDGDNIVIYTRTGGGNRDYYDSEECCKQCYPEDFEGDESEHPSGPWNDDLRQHKLYLYDEDDDFDSTYAYFRFSFPPEYAEDLKAISEKKADHTPSEKWQQLFESFSAKKENA